MYKENLIVTLKELFPDIRFNIRPCINEEIKIIFDSASEDFSQYEYSEHLYFVLRSLEDDLRKAKIKLSKIIKLHKNGELGIEEVQDHQFNVHELELEIKEILFKLDL